MRAIPLFLTALLAACADNSMSPPPPPPATTITVAYCDPYVPLWVAFQDGDGVWTRVQPVSAPGRTEFTYAFASNRGAIATVSPGGPLLTSLQVFYGTPDELTAVSLSSPRFCGSPFKTLRGSVAGLDTNELAFLDAGFVSQGLYPGTDSFVLNDVLPGPRDILATRLTRTGGFTVLSKLILRRALDLPDGATLPVFDFESPEAFAPAAGHVTLGGAPDGGFVTTSLLTSNFQNGFFIPGQSVAGPVQPFLAIPESRLLPGDLQIVRASTHNINSDGLRSGSLYFRMPGELNLALGPEVLAPTFTTVATTPSLRIRARFDQQVEYDRAASITYQQDSTRLVTVLFTAAYARLTGSGADLVVPEFSGVNGFDLRWALSPVPSLRWSANRIGGTVGLGFDPAVADGAVQRSAFTQGTLTP